MLGNRWHGKAALVDNLVLTLAEPLRGDVQLPAEDPTMPRVLLCLISIFLVTPLVSPVSAAPTPAQRCQADIELASAKYSQCRLRVEAAFATTADGTRRSTALGRCSEKLGAAFAKASQKYGSANCTASPVGEFDSYLGQCADNVAAGAEAGAQLARCGNGVRDSSEQCDANDLGGATCATLGYTRGGSLSCTSTCSFDASACRSQAFQATGQTTCWGGPRTAPVEIPCSGTGQDGETQFGAPLAYADNGDGTVTDLNTGLTWEKKSDDDTLHDKDLLYPWAGLCSGDNATLCSRDADCAAAGGTCDTGDAQTPAPNGITIFEWLDQINAVNFAGHNDWRVPNAREMNSLLAFETSSISDVFNTNCGDSLSGNPGCNLHECSCTGNERYWTSTIRAGAGREAWTQQFGAGYLSWAGKEGQFAVRAVRGGS